MADPIRDPASAFGKFLGVLVKEGLREEAYKDRIRALEADLAKREGLFNDLFVEWEKRGKERDAALAAKNEFLARANVLRIERDDACFERDAALATQNRLAEAYKQMSERQEDTAAERDAAKNEFLARANVLRIERDDARAEAEALRVENAALIDWAEGEGVTNIRELYQARLSGGAPEQTIPLPQGSPYTAAAGAPCPGIPEVTDDEDYRIVCEPPIHCPGCPSAKGGGA